MNNEVKGWLIFASVVATVIVCMTVIAVHWNSVQRDAAIACAEAGKNWYNSNCLDKPLPE